VKDFINEHNLKFVRFDGCVLGIKSRSGKPILKPWKVASTLDELVQGFGKYRCDQKHDHAQCRGADAKLSEAYSPELLKLCIRHSGNTCRKLLVRWGD
jgi:hypothetical protein